MNHRVHSVECLHGLCSACSFEDCACDCHVEDVLMCDLEDQAPPAKEYPFDEAA